MFDVYGVGLLCLLLFVGMLRVCVLLVVCRCLFVVVVDVVWFVRWLMFDVVGGGCGGVLGVACVASLVVRVYCWL